MFTDLDFQIFDYVHADQEVVGKALNDLSIVYIDVSATEIQVERDRATRKKWFVIDHSKRDLFTSIKPYFFVIYKLIRKCGYARTCINYATEYGFAKSGLYKWKMTTYIIHVRNLRLT